ncbi:multi-sensor signal transduction histidine kinase [Methanoculleus bourgensis MS2]|uniref:histidine kinase n=1 Tax=Methanoculleus bourgensis (strain ATCC 43281 / DSM 3045 / OCM 15 / MS2) TaxID=1201294 RepID=I7LL26_METBM|nr:PAS domain S-box protein [Methanoculleus bourgensis]CCJ35004.1 multi-sensor signal transduction histidine kinase [Methanoculleus bourgensis MS2]
MTPIRPPGTIYEAPPEYRILDGVDDWCLLVGEDHKIVWANPAFRRVLGVPEGDLWQAIHALGGDGDLAGRILAALKDEGEAPEFECRIRDLEGGERRCLCSGRKAPSDEGWLLWFREFPDAGDYEKIVEYTGTATILIEDGGTISVANTEFERLSGYPRREIVGVKRLTDFVPRAEELRRITGYHTLRRSDPLAAPKNYSFSFADRSGNIHTVEATIGMIPGTNRSVMSLLDVTGRRRAEQALQESEERLNLALMAANDGLVDWDLGTGTIFYSPRCFTMLGYEPGEFVPTVSSLLSLVHPEDRDRVEAALNDMVAEGRDRFEMEFRARSASGRWIYVLDRLQVVSRDADGMPLRIVGTHSDITERKAAERELLIREMAMESSLSAIAIADLDGYLTYANQALLEMGGLTDPGKILGRHLAEFWADPGKVGEVLRMLAERGKCSEELTGRRADGTEFTAHVTLNFVTERSGDPVCIMATAVDVTEQRRMEEALRESEKRYRALAESAPDIIFLVDMEGNALYVNSAGGRLLDREPGALQGMNVREMFPPRIAERWVAMLRKAAEPAAGSLTEETLLLGDDGGTWLETRLIPMTESDGTVRNLLGISRDVTRRKRVEEQLQFQALVLGQVDDAVIAVDADGRITYMNRAAERLYGVSSSEALGRLNTDFFTYEWLRPDDEEEAQTALQDPGIWRGVTIHRKRDGEALFVDATLSALEDDRGNATGMLCSLRDITEQKRADLELRIKDMAIASSLGAVALADLEGRIIYVNRASLAVHGWEREEEVIGKPFSMIWADREEGERTRVEALRNGAWLGEIEAQRCDGTTFPMQLALSVVTDESGRPLCLMGSGIDIGQRKLAEQDLRIRDMAIASSLNAFTISDLDGRLTYVNQAFLSMWGYTSAAEVLGRSITEFWQDEEDATDALRALLVSGRYVGERIGRRRDGTAFYVTYSGNLVTNDAGAPICLMASIADITDLKRAEAEIQAHNRKLSVLNQIIGVSTSATDIEEALEDVLAATIALLDLRGGGIYLVEPGRQSARLVCVRGMPDDFIPPPGVPDIAVPPYADVFVAGEPLFVDDPGERDIPPYASIPIVAPGRVVGSLNVVPHDRKQFTDVERSLLVAIGREIGSSIERTMLIRQLERAKREANLYLDILSHDIRNAENVSSLYTDLLINMLEGEARGYAQRLRSSIRKSIEILRNVSTIRRIHHESTILVPVDLDQVIQDEIEIFSEVTFQYDRRDLVIMADQLLPEVFTNLIGNAIKFGGPAVEVTIRVEESGDDVLVSIEDTGPGVPDEMKEAVFMRFGQSRNQKSGQGLGLYITRMLITRYGGRIWVDDRVPGHPECGAAFRFTLKRTT